MPFKDGKLAFDPKKNQLIDFGENNVINDVPSFNP
jgi:hypothetical protein